MLTTLETLVVAWLPVLLDATIKGTVILTLAGLLSLSMRRASAAPRHSVWFWAMAGLLLLPLLSLTLPGWQILPSWCNLNAEMAAACADNEPLAHVDGCAENGITVNAPSIAQTVDVEPSPGSLDRPTTISPPPFSEPVEGEPVAAPTALDGGTLLPLWLWLWLAGLWVIGTLAATAPIVLGKLSLWWIERNARRIVDGPWIDLLKQAAGELKLQRKVRLLQTDRCSSPLVAGIRRPKFLLPNEYASWTLERRQVVMLHELGHVKRWDCLTQMIAQIACAVYWFNPLVWVAFRRMQIEAERACDDLVLAGGSAPCDYAEHLLQIAAAQRTPRLAANSAIAMARPSTLEGRLLAILDAKRSRRGLTRAGALLLASAIAGTTAVIACVGAESSPAEIHAVADDNGDRSEVKDNRPVNAVVGFGQVKERALPFGAPCAQYLFQFRNGELFVDGHGPETTEKEAAQDWKKIEDAGGVDLGASGGATWFQLWGEKCLFTRDLRGLSWEKTTAEEVIAKMKQVEFVEQPKADAPFDPFAAATGGGSGILELKAQDLPITYLVKTARGEVGVMEVLSIVEDKRGHSGDGHGHGMKFRYKMVRGDPEPRQDAARYRTLYARYKGLIADAARSGDEAQVLKITEQFNDSIGGKLIYAGVFRSGSTPLISRCFGREPFPLPMVNYGASDSGKVMVSPCNDYFLVETPNPRDLDKLRVRLAFAAVGADGDTPEALAERFIAAVNAKNLKKQQAIIHPLCFADLSAVQKQFLDEALARDFRKTVPEKRTVKVSKLQEGKLPFADMMVWKIEPTHQIEIVFSTAKYSDTRLIRFAAKEKGRWFVVVPMLNAENLKRYEERKTSQPDAATGEKVGEVQCRLRSTKRIWEAGEPLRFDAEVWNTGPNKWTRPTHPFTRCRVEFDEQWYHWVGQVAQEPGKEGFPQAAIGRQPKILPIVVTWAWHDDRRQWLKLPAGKHVVRVALDANPAGDTNSKPTVAITNAVEIEIVEAKDPAPQAPWGPASEGIQARLRAEKNLWKRGEIPTLKFDMRNRSKRELCAFRHEAMYELEFDGHWYKWVGNLSLQNSWFPTGRQYHDIPVILGEHWQSKTGKKPPPLTVGEHTVRVAFVSRPPTPKGPNVPPPVRCVSNSVEIKIVDSSAQTGKKAQHERRIDGTVVVAMPDCSQGLCTILSSLTSQENSERIVGESLGERPVPNAIVTAKSNGVTREEVSDSEGKFTFTNLPIGLYEFSARSHTQPVGRDGERIVSAAKSVRVVEKKGIVRLAVSEEFVTVSGRITNVGGRPVAGAAVTRTAVPVREVGPLQIVRTVSDANGSYALKGFEPVSFWRVGGYLHGGSLDAPGAFRTQVEIRVVAEGFQQSKDNVPRVPLIAEAQLVPARRLWKTMSRLARTAGKGEHLPEIKDRQLPSSRGSAITQVDIVLAYEANATYSNAKR